MRSLLRCMAVSSRVLFGEEDHLENVMMGFSGRGVLEHRMRSRELVKMYDSEFEGPNRRGRPLERWKNRVKEYLGEKGVSGRGALEQTRRECCDTARERGFRAIDTQPLKYKSLICMNLV